MNSNKEVKVISDKDLGWLPLLSLSAAVGLLLVAIADTAARNGMWWAESLFWVGLLMIFVPIAGRIVSIRESEKECLGLIIVLGLSLYLVKVLHSPLSFTSYDELLQWRTTNDILQSNHLFLVNPILPVSSFFPGLGIVTSALVDLSGLGLFSAGLLVIGGSRLILVLALFLFYKEVSQSTQLAGIATLLYMTNQNFISFNAQFAYESMALAFVMLILFAIVRRFRGQVVIFIGLSITILLGIGALVITHHVASYALTAFLILWSVTFYIFGALSQLRFMFDGKSTPKNSIFSFPQRLISSSYQQVDSTKEKVHYDPSSTALLMLVISLVWLVFVASLAINYLSGPLVKTVTEFIQMILSEQNGRQLFRDYSGQISPLWERLTSYSAVGLISLSLPFGLFQVWKHYRKNILAVVLAICTLAYPISLILRLTQSVTIVARASEFLFVAIAFVLAIVVTDLWLPNLAGWKMVFIFITWVTVIFCGGVILGWGDWLRLPGPYLVVADNRSIEPQGLASASWTRDHLGRENRIAADRINALLMASYGDQHPVTGSEVGNVPVLFFSAELDATDQSILRQGQIRYIVIDHRLSRALPKNGIYFETNEPGAYEHKIPINLSALDKFDRVKEVSRIYDSGDIVIYDSEKLINTP